MSSQYYRNEPQPIQQADGGAVFELKSENERIAYMKSLGAKNVDPPLPKSSHLKIIATGRVLPYNDMLAEQRDLVQNCDQFGNTDPAVWGQTVDTTEVSPEEHRLAMLRAMETVLGQANQMTAPGRQPQVDPSTSYPADYPKGIIAISDIQNLHSLLES